MTKLLQDQVRKDSRHEQDELQAGVTRFLDAFCAVERLKTHQLAEQLGLTKRTLNRLRSGETNMLTHHVARIAKRTGLTPGFIAVAAGRDLSEHQLIELYRDRARLDQAISELLDMPGGDRAAVTSIIHSSWVARNTRRDRAGDVIVPF